MKKLLAVAALGALASFGNSAQADCDGSWTQMCFMQGPTREGGAVPGPRSDADKAEMAEMSDAIGDMNFVSLGFGGSIILKNSCKIANVIGADVTLFETTWGNPPDDAGVSEEAKVWASQDGINWVFLGTGIHNESYDIILPWAQYFKIKDITNANPMLVGDGNDAYDVDGMTYEALLPEDPGLDPGLCGFHQGWAKGSPAVSGAGIHPYRKNHLAATTLEDYPALSSFFDRDNNLTYTMPAPKHYNFWSMGFGSVADPSYMCFVLPYAVFDGPGSEFQLFETTWNNKPCPNYPETVQLYCSQDGVSWTSVGALCKDGFLDLSATPFAGSWVGYLKYVDITSPGAFSAGADAYDIDGFLILQDPPTDDTPGDICASAPSRKVVAPVDFKDNSIVPEEMEVLQVLGNPVTSDINVRFTNAEENAVNFIVRNHMGQEISRTSHVGDLFQVEEKTIPASDLAAGVYFITLEGQGYKETVKFVKK